MTTIVTNLEWLRLRTARYVQFNPDEADEAFSGPQGAPWQLIDEAINEAYKAIIFDAANDVDPDFFKFSQVFSWPATDITYTLPTGISRTSIIDLRDVTAGLPGTQLRPTAGYNGSSEIYWSGMDIISWGETGPGTDTSLMIIWRGVPQRLSEPTQQPFLLPDEYRDMLPLGAAILLRSEADEDNIPQTWLARYNEQKSRFHKAISQASEAGEYVDNSQMILR